MKDNMKAGDTIYGYDFKGVKEYTIVKVGRKYITLNTGDRLNHYFQTIDTVRNCAFTLDREKAYNYPERLRKINAIKEATTFFSSTLEKLSNDDLQSILDILTPYLGN